MAETAEAIIATAPGVLPRLSIADNRLVAAIRDTSVPAAVLIERARARRAHGRPLTLVPRNPLLAFAREAPVRLMAASVLTR